MDFFAHQEQAHRLTVRLVFLFGLAVLGIIITCYFLAVFALAYAQYGPEWEMVHLWDPVLFTWVTIGTASVVGLCSGFKILQLRGGGSVVAEELGGRRLSPQSTDPMERKILNVVEEMAIASGVPTPPVYMMDREPGINAFAAGYTPQNAVIAVTRGCVEQLNRDELQGVIAHEFSHIFNGDMRINIRLMGILFGILVIGMMGYYAFRMTPYRTSNEDRTGVFILVIGLGLVIIGSIGTFFGNMIKAAVGRQREFLADASAVQFTRNPEGIAGALKKIAGYKMGSSILNPRAPEASHMFFAKGVFSGLFATHPPIDERIRRLDASWKGSTDKQEGSLDFVSSIGTWRDEHVDAARSFIGSMPTGDLEALRDPEQVSQAILQFLETDKSAQEKIAAIHLAIPALSQLSLKEYVQFKANLQELIHEDQKVDLVEWLTWRTLGEHLDPLYYPQKEIKRPSKQLVAITPSAKRFFTLMQHADEKQRVDVEGLDQALQELDQLIPPDKRLFLEKLVGMAHSPLQQELLVVLGESLRCPIPYKGQS